MTSQTIVAQLDALTSRLSQIAREMEAGSNPLATNSTARIALANNMDNVMTTFLTPENRVNLMIFHTAHLATIRLFLKWKAFDAIPAEEGAAISYADLAARLGAEESLISERNSRLYLPSECQTHPRVSSIHPRPRRAGHSPPRRHRHRRPHRLLQGAHDADCQSLRPADVPTTPTIPLTLFSPPPSPPSPLTPPTQGRQQHDLLRRHAQLLLPLRPH